MESFKRVMLPISMVLLSLGFWHYPNFEKIAAGVALFLFGLTLLERGVQGFSGGLFEKALQKITRSTPRAIAFGMVSTSMVQSSTIVMVLTISFLSAGMISLVSGIGVVVGANIGTTSGSWLIATFGLSVSLSALAMPFLIFGVLLQFQSASLWKSFGSLLLGMGLLFLGIDYIKEGFSALHFGFDLDSLAPPGILSTLLFIGVGFVITIVLQSSHATLLVTLSALAAGHVSYALAVALTMGACVGTTIIPLISSLGANAAGRRLALAHFIFNLSTLIVAVPLLPVLMWLVDLVALGLDISPEQSTLKLAIFHTQFSLLGAVLILSQKYRLESWLIRLIPEPESTEEKPKYLNLAALESSATAIAVARSETAHLYELTTRTIIEGLGWSVDEFYTDQPLAELKSARNNIPFNMRENYQQRIKGIYSALIGFISAAREKAQDHQDDQLRELWAASYHMIEAVKGAKHLQKNMKLYLHHANENISRSYKGIRQQIGEIIRINNALQTTEDPTESRLALDHQMLLTERNRDETNNLIAGLIRTRKVTTTMATSLMTDKGYAYDICTSLISVGRLLFIDSSKPQAKNPESLDLEASDLNAINQQLGEQLAILSAEDQP